MSAPTRGATTDDSSARRLLRRGLDADFLLSVGLVIAGLAGAALLVVAGVSAILETPAEPVVIDRLRGGDRHNYAFIPIAILSLVLLFGAVRGRSRPAAIGVIILGGIA